MSWPVSALSEELFYLVFSFRLTWYLLRAVQSQLLTHLKHHSQECLLEVAPSGLSTSPSAGPHTLGGVPLTLASPSDRDPAGEGPGDLSLHPAPPPPVPTQTSVGAGVFPWEAVGSAACVSVNLTLSSSVALGRT